jgi:uncharacterized membrane protein YkvA (DUF1232 family)
MFVIGRKVEKWKNKARTLKQNVHVLYLSARHPATPWYAKLFAACVVAYVFSPIDLIPDFIPVIGYLDDLILVPLGIALAVRMIPPEVLSECRSRAEDRSSSKKTVNWAAGVLILALWLVMAVWLGRLVYQAWRG